MSCDSPVLHFADGKCHVARGALKVAHVIWTATRKRKRRVKRCNEKGKGRSEMRRMKETISAPVAI
jgi:hypothetical protein